MIRIMSEVATIEKSAHEWVSYVWIDKNGEPRSLQTIGERQADGARLEPGAYQVQSIESNLTGYPPRGDAVFFAHPFAVYESPIQSLQGVILLCHIVAASGEPQHPAEHKGEQIAAGAGVVPIDGLDQVDVTQQFYLTTKFVPLSFASNPPKEPGPFGCGVGTDVAVRRQLVGRVVGMLTALKFDVNRMTPLVTPSHWGITLNWIPSKVSQAEMANRVMVMRYLIGMVCEEAGLTPLFATQVFKDGKVWPPSVLQLVAHSTHTVIPNAGEFAKRLRSGHEALIHGTAPGIKTGQEVEAYVWGDNAPGPVWVASHTPSRTMQLTDNRIASSANPHVALGLWVSGWNEAA